MDSLNIKLLNPKAMRLLKDLADMKLISIDEQKKETLSGILSKLRSKSQAAPSLSEITKEVEAVRSKRHGK